MALNVVGLFAGIGGIEFGLEQSGHRSTLLCEIDSGARAVLSSRFPDVALVDDVREIDRLPDADLVAAGFPCQDLSQAGRTAGISGTKSSVVAEVFRLLRVSDPTWVMLENVPFMLQLGRGSAIRYVTSSLAELGFRWAYRTVDTRSFGIPQRRRRVILLASRREDPRTVLFSQGTTEPPPDDHRTRACGFYWTEGLKGLGWAVDAVPTLKGGSTIGIPSPPAIRLTDGVIGTPDLRDAERLQGFPADWTKPAEAVARRGMRWKLVGNAVSVPVAAWVGQRLLSPKAPEGLSRDAIPVSGSWPSAGWGERDGSAFRAALGPWPVRLPYEHLSDFLVHETTPLSVRATRGFLHRARSSTLRFPEGFVAEVESHLETMLGASLLPI